MLFNGFWDIKNDRFARYRPGEPKKVAPPALPPPAVKPTEISAEAAKAGEAEKRRLRRRRGRASTIMTPGFMRSATIERAGLKTTLG